MNLYHVTKFSPYFSFTVYCFYTKISSFMPVLSKRIVLDCFYLLIFYFEKFSTDVCRLPCAVNVNLNLSNYYHYYYYHYLASELSNETSVVSSSSIRSVLVDWLLCILYPQGLFLRQLSPSAIFFRKFSRTEVLQKATNLILVCKNRQSPLHYRSRSNH